MQSRLRRWARHLKSEIMALYLSYRHPQTPLYAKLVAIIVVAYALSPIDLIPDFIPVLGYLDDVLLLPLGIFLAIQLLPDDIMAACREEAASLDQRPTFRWMSGVIIVFWLLCVGIVIRVIMNV